MDQWINSVTFNKFKEYGIDCINNTIHLKKDEVGPVSDLTIEMLFNRIHEAFLAMTGEKSMCSKFMGVLMVFSESTNEMEALREWQMGIIGLDIYNKCICSHPISNNHYIRNTKNGNSLVVGSDCILKFSFDENTKQSVKYQKRMKSDLDRTKTYRPCEDCGNYVNDIDAHPKTKCYSCVEKLSYEIVNCSNHETCDNNGYKYIMVENDGMCIPCIVKNSGPLNINTFNTIFNDIQQHRQIYLDVPYKEKEHAKRLGCRWDPIHRSWYCFDGNQECITLWGKESYKIIHGNKVPFTMIHAV